MDATVLLLGDSGVGKSTFLTALIPFVDTGNLIAVRNSSQILRNEDQAYTTYVKRRNGTKVTTHFIDNTNPRSYLLCHPTAIILCFDVQKPETLESVQKRWRYEVETHFNADERLPVLLLGLKRDTPYQDNGASEHKSSVIPEKAVGEAQAMRLDVYAECSAVTGTTLRQACEDVARFALRSVREGNTESDYCVVS